MLFFVYRNTASDWDDDICVLIKGAIKVNLILDVRVESGMLEGIEGNIHLFEEEEVP